MCIYIYIYIIIVIVIVLSQIIAQKAKQIPTGRFGQKTTVSLALQTIETHLSGFISRGTNKGNPM